MSVVWTDGAEERVRETVRPRGRPHAHPRKKIRARDVYLSDEQMEEVLLVTGANSLTEIVRSILQQRTHSE